LLAEKRLMGREARCVVTLGGTSADAKVHLDSDAVRARGGVRLDAPFVEVRDLDVRGGALHFTAACGTVALALGEAEAQRWLKAIREPKSLLDKLGIKAGTRVCIRGELDPAFVEQLAERLGEPPATALRGSFDAIVAAIDSPEDFRSFDGFRSHLEPNGMLWLIAPKGKGSPVPEALLRQAFLAARFVDVKVAGFSTTHTAVKVVIPVAQRAK
jgi:hypothetical protein